MLKDEFTKIFISFIKPGHRVLDLGANQGEYSQIFIDNGAKVTAVDYNLPDLLGKDIIVKKMKVEEFINQDSDKYDMVFMSNILQFLEKQWVVEILVPWLDKHMTTDAVIGMRTFYQEPEPPFDHPMISLYTIGDLTHYFMSWQELYAKQYDHYGPDMKGNTRHFFISDMIIKK